MDAQEWLDQANRDSAALRQLIRDWHPSSQRHLRVEVDKFRTLLPAE